MEEESMTTSPSEESLKSEAMEEMREFDSKSAKEVISKIREAYLFIGNKLGYASALRKEFEAEMALEKSLHPSTKSDKFIRAKVKAKVYGIYEARCAAIMKEWDSFVETLLWGYSPQKKRLWKLYFMEGNTLERSCEIMNIPQRTAQRWLTEMKRDLERAK